MAVNTPAAASKRRRKKKETLVANDAVKTEEKVYHEITANLATDVKVRREKMEDREYLVVPMIMITHGVHAGSKGPMYYPGDELNRRPEVWNHKPIVVYHPEIDGQQVSACDPKILNEQKVGVILNSKYKGDKLHAEAWIDEARAKLVDKRVIDAIENKKMMEVSTGLFADAEQTEGEYKGKSYKGIARNFGPDHLALLPDKVGACSIADGAGFLRNEQQTKHDVERVISQAVTDAVKRFGLLSNEMSHSNIRDALFNALRDSLRRDDNQPMAWIEDVYDEFFIYSDQGKLFRQTYTANDTQVTIEGSPEEVVRVTEYRTPSGSFVGNVNSQETDSMSKEEMVTAIIGNESGEWKKADRDYLLKLDERVLKGMVSVETKPVVNEGTTTTPAPQPQRSPTTNETTNTSPAPTPVVNAEQYIQNAPPEIREVLQAGVNSAKKEREALIARIVANKNNAFTAEYLATQPLDVLNGMARLASADAVANAAPSILIPNYSGQAGPAPTTNAVQEEPLVAPTLDFTPKA